MIIRWDPFDIRSAFQAFEELREKMERLSQEVFQPWAGEELWETRNWKGAPYVHIRDLGDRYLMLMDAPGLDEKSLKISANAEGITISGERKNTAPEGYAVYRQERPSFQFSRSFSFPSRIDVEKISATLKDGILNVEIHKAPEAKPREISVKVK